MKMKRVKTNLELVQVDCEPGCSIDTGLEYKYIFRSNIPIMHESAEVTHEIKIPETIKEFLESHGLKKKELVEWLNENYKS